MHSAGADPGFCCRGGGGGGQMLAPALKIVSEWGGGEEGYSDTFSLRHLHYGVGAPSAYISDICGDKHAKKYKQKQYQNRKELKVIHM